MPCRRGTDVSGGRSDIGSGATAPTARTRCRRRGIGRGDGDDDCANLLLQVSSHPEACLQALFACPRGNQRLLVVQSQDFKTVFAEHVEGTGHGTDFVLPIKEEAFAAEVAEGKADDEDEDRAADEQQEQPKRLRFDPRANN